MTSFEEKSDDSPSGNPQLPAGDNLLPPVEPPSAGFIIQLFVVPALIVLVIVSVWFTFSWLVRRTATHPQDLIRGLEQGASIARWQRASELADMLRNERFAEFKRSPTEAEQLAGILNRAIDEADPAGAMDENEVAFRAFLAKALGEFEVNDGVEVLLKAANTNRGPAERLVRYYAIDALAVRAFNLQRLEPPQDLEHTDLVPTLSRLASDEDPLIRRRTAYALDKLGTPEAIERLEPMADDPDPDTRYNAAVGLAHHGNERAVETLAEMIDVEELASVQEESVEQDRVFKRAVIVGNALQAVEALAQKNPGADLSLVTESLERLSTAEADELARVYIPTRAAANARRVLEALRTKGVETIAL